MARPAVVSMEKSERIKVLAIESSRMNSQLLAEALALDSDLEVVGIEAKPASIRAAVARHRPNVILISTVLEDSGTQGFELARQISATCPASRVVLLMDTSHPAAVVEAFRCGARGIFSRTESSTRLAKCIHSVHQGQVWANSAELLYVLEALRASKPMRPVESEGGGASLSKREKDVVCRVAEGLSNREIAGRLGLTEHTVKNYLFRIFDKLGVSSRVEVALYVFRFCQDWMVASASNRGSARTSARTSGPRLLTALAKSAGVTRAAVPPAAVV